MSEVIPEDVGANQAGVQRKYTTTIHNLISSLLLSLFIPCTTKTRFTFLSTLTWHFIPLVQVVRLLVTRTVRGAVMPVDK